MPPTADLIKLVFASGPAHLNREMIDRVAAAAPELPLYVVGEFQPHRGEWIPWHLLRSFRENLATVRAAIGERRIQVAAMMLAPEIPLAKMRFIAVAVAGGSLVAYDKDLQIVKGAGWAKHILQRVSKAAGSQRTRLWMRRLANPAEAEIPLRARAAQIYGATASRLRTAQVEAPIQGEELLTKGVCVVVPSRNGRELLASMLPALLPQLANGELIVSDNGSSDGTADWLSQHYPAVRVIRNEEPLSFARAVNAGIVACRFARTLLLNNDMIVQPGFVEALNSAFDSVPDLFCATAQIFFPASIRREETGKAVWRKEHPQDFPVRCDEPVPGEDLSWVLYGSGGCSLFDTTKLRAMGGVSEVFDPAYVEDLDLGYRAWKRGWPSVFCAGAQVEHRHRATTSRYYTAQQLDTFVERNYLRFLIHATGSPALFLRLWMEAIRRLQLRAMEGNTAALETLRQLPTIGPRPPHATGVLSETEILALGNGDIAIFPGHASAKDRTVVIATPYLPFPLSHGGAVRMYNLMKLTASDRNQVLLAFTDELILPPAELLEICRAIVLVRRRGSHYRRDTPLPDVVEEFASETFRACLKQTIQRWAPDLVQLEFTQMAQYAPDCHPARTFLVEHDITFDLQQQLLAASTETGAARLELERQLEKWRVFETSAWRKVDCVVTMSPKDERMVTGSSRTACLPNGVDTGRFMPARAEPEPRRLLFIGSFAHLPNLLALDFFLGEVWPLLGAGFTLHIIAGARHEYFLDFHRTSVSLHLTQQLANPRIELDGFMADVRDAYSRAELVVAPLTASAGTNIKVLEAMAMGRAVISTPAGINGLDLAPGSDVVVAATANDLARNILSLASDSETRRRIELHARESALRYDWREIAQAQARLYDSLTPHATQHLTQPPSLPSTVSPARG